MCWTFLPWDDQSINGVDYLSDSFVTHCRLLKVLPVQGESSDKVSLRNGILEEKCFLGRVLKCLAVGVPAVVSSSTRYFSCNQLDLFGEFHFKTQDVGLSFPLAFLASKCVTVQTCILWLWKKKHWITCSSLKKFGLKTMLFEYLRRQYKQVLSSAHLVYLSSCWMPKFCICNSK